MEDGYQPCAWWQGAQWQGLQIRATASQKLYFLQKHPTLSDIFLDALIPFSKGPTTSDFFQRTRLIHSSI